MKRESACTHESFKKKIAKTLNAKQPILFLENPIFSFFENSFRIFFLNLFQTLLSYSFVCACVRVFCDVSSSSLVFEDLTQAKGLRKREVARGPVPVCACFVIGKLRREGCVREQVPLALLHTHTHTHTYCRWCLTDIEIKTIWCCLTNYLSLSGNSTRQTNCN